MLALYLVLLADLGDHPLLLLVLELEESVVVVESVVSLLLEMTLNTGRLLHKV